MEIDTYGAVFVIFLLVGCAKNISGYIMPGESLDRNLIYVLEKNKGDKHEIYQIVKEQLTDKGLKVYFGNELPDHITSDIDVKYGTQWRWDATWYLLNFNVRFYDSNSAFLVASAQSSRTSLVREEPSSMVQEALNQLFQNKQQNLE